METPKRPSFEGLTDPGHERASRLPLAEPVSVRRRQGPSFKRAGLGRS